MWRYVFFFLFVLFLFFKVEFENNSWEEGYRVVGGGGGGDESGNFVENLGVVFESLLGGGGGWEYSDGSEVKYFFVCLLVWSKGMWVDMMCKCEELRVYCGELRCGGVLVDMMDYYFLSIFFFLFL